MWNAAVTVASSLHRSAARSLRAVRGVVEGDRVDERLAMVDERALHRDRLVIAAIAAAAIDGTGTRTCEQRSPAVRRGQLLATRSLVAGSPPCSTARGWVAAAPSTPSARLDSRPTVRIAQSHIRCGASALNHSAK
jgi:hypothetical protein